MHFTVHFRGENTYEEDYSYGLVFSPNPVWVKGNVKLLDLGGDEPGYREGSVKLLLEKEGLTDTFEKPMSAAIVVHRVGLGTSKDFTTLIYDIENEGFETTIFD